MECKVVKSYHSKQRHEDKQMHLDIRETYAHASNHAHGKKSPDDHMRFSTVVDIA